jgi:octaprenyl-diphosphate synthase
VIGAEILPAEPDLTLLVDEFFRTSFSTDNPLITEAVRRMLAAGGKRLRPKLTLLAAEAAGGKGAEHLPLAAYMELIHVATLIHDDVVDRADLRRGVNATAVDYGNRVSVLAGDYLFAWIFKNVTAGYPAPIPHILSSTLAAICDGEVLQLRALRDLDLPVSNYLEIVTRKTAALFAASAECGAIMAGAAPALVRALRDFGLSYGIAFQMLDDVLDMSADPASLGKPVGNDVRERKVTLPLLYALEAGGASFRSLLRAYYDDDGEDPEKVAAIVAAVATLGGLARARETLATYAERAKTSLAPLGNAPARSNLCALADALARC